MLLSCLDFVLSLFMFVCFSVCLPFCVYVFVLCVYLGRVVFMSGFRSLFVVVFVCVSCICVFLDVVFRSLCRVFVFVLCDVLLCLCVSSLFVRFICMSCCVHVVCVAVSMCRPLCSICYS